jgi:hypothetical protein
MTSYTGVFLLVFSVSVVGLDTVNFFAIGTSLFTMLIGIMLVIWESWEDSKRNLKQLQPIQRL